MGDGGDELRLGGLRLLDFQGHIVDGVDQLADLVVIFFLDLRPVAPAGNEPGGVDDAGQGLYQGADKIEVGKVHHGHEQRHNQGHHGHAQDKLAVDLRHRSYEPDDPHDGPLVDYRGGGGHDRLFCRRVPARPHLGGALLQGVGDVRGAGSGAGGEAVAGKEHRAGGVDELHLQLAAVLEVADIVLRGNLIFAAGVAFKGIGGQLCPGGQVGGDGVGVVGPQGHRKGGPQQHHNQRQHADAVEQPAPADAANLTLVLELNALGHRLPSPLIPKAPDCIDIHGAGGVVLDFNAQAADVHIHDFQLAKIILAPHAVQNLLP